MMAHMQTLCESARAGRHAQLYEFYLLTEDYQISIFHILHKRRQERDRKSLHLAERLEAPELADVGEAAQQGVEIAAGQRQQRPVAHRLHAGRPRRLSLNIFWCYRNWA